MRRDLRPDVDLSIRMGIALVLSAALYLAAEVLLLVLIVWAFREGAGGVGAALAVVAALLPVLLWLQIQGSGYVALSALRARRPKDEERRELEPLIARTAAQADLPPPVLRMIGSRTPNALAIASGRTYAEGPGRRRRIGPTIVLTTELVRRLDASELEAVVAHELTHLANRDAAVLTFVAGPAIFTRRLLSENPVFACFALVLIWPAWLLSVVLTWTVSRCREYSADRGSALVTGSPEAMISALRELTSSAPPKADLRGGSAARSLWIVSPSTPRYSVLSEHPPIERRIDRLERLAAELRAPPT